MEVDDEGVGSAYHMGSNQDMVLHDMGGSHSMTVCACGCMVDTHVVFCPQERKSYYQLVPYGSHQKLFGFPDHEPDERNSSLVWTHP